MANYIFKRTGAQGTDAEVRVSLAHVREELEKELGKAQGAGWGWFDVLEHMGIGVLLCTGGFEVTQEAFDQWKSQLVENGRWEKLALSPRAEATMRKFLYEEYTFAGWR